MAEEVKRTVYRVNGFSCSGCAATFEKNVKSLPTVKDAQVNFGAAKLTVYGDASIEELEKAGAFEGIKVYPEKQKAEVTQAPLWKRKSAVRTAISAVLLLVGWLTGEQLGEESMRSVLAYGLSIIIGGYPLFLAH